MHLSTEAQLTWSRNTFEQRWSVTRSMKSFTSAQVHCCGGAAEGRDGPTSRGSVGGAGTRTFALLVSSCIVEEGGEGWEGGGGEALGSGRLV